MIILIIEVFVFLIYVMSISIEYGIPRSISESWYLMPNRDRYLFTLFCFTIGILHTFHGGVFFFLSGSALTFVGVASGFKEKSIERYAHTIGSLISILLSLAGLIYNGVVFPVIAIVIIAIAIRREENATYWTEVFAFLFISLGIVLIKQ